MLVPLHKVLPDPVVPVAVLDGWVDRVVNSWTVHIAVTRTDRPDFADTHEVLDRAEMAVQAIVLEHC